MTRTELAMRILGACKGTSGSDLVDRRRALQVITWLYAVAASERGLGSAGSRWTLADRRRALRRADLIPAEHPIVLADVAEALGVGPGDWAAVTRLGWALRGPTGRLARADYPRANELMLRETLAELAYRRLPEAA